MNEQYPRQLAATMYRIRGLDTARFVFRVIRIRENLPKDNYVAKRLQAWATELWRKHLHQPVYVTRLDDIPGFITPEVNLSPGFCISVCDVPDVVYHLEVTADRLEVSMQDATGPERELACRLVERAFADKFLNLPSKYWKAEWRLFFRQNPENRDVDRDTLNAYRGVRFGVLFLPEAGLYLAADVRTKYIDRRSLLEHLQAGTRFAIREHVEPERAEDRAYFVRDNGRTKHACRYAGDTGLTVSECTFGDGSQTVYEYYRQRYPGLHVSPNEPAVFVIDRLHESSRPVPASRLFPVYTSEHPAFRQCTVRPQMTPHERIQTIACFLQDLAGARHGDQCLRVDSTNFLAERTAFAPSRLEFGGGYTLEPFQQGRPSTASSTWDNCVAKWSSAKITSLYAAGPYDNEPLPDMVLLYPASLDRASREAFVQALRDELAKQTKQRVRVLAQESYAAQGSDRYGSAFLRAAGDVRSRCPGALLLAVLRDEFEPTVHGDFKEIVRPMLSQCVTEKVLRSIAGQQDPRRATSQVRNLALAVLTEAGVVPWVLADRLHYDLYVGIDLLYGRVAYHFLYSIGGREMRSRYGQASSRGRAHETVRRPELRQTLEDTIRSIVGSQNRVKSIVVHRDGRWWPRESAGFHQALDALLHDGVLPSDIVWAVVEVKKNHIPVRLLTAVPGSSTPFLNPSPGMFLILDPRRVLLATTGRPQAWDVLSGRTAGTLLLEVVECSKDVDIEWIAEDAYRLTHLNWNAPDIEIALPVTIRWSDEALRECVQTQDDALDPDAVDSYPESQSDEQVSEEEG